MPDTDASRCIISILEEVPIEFDKTDEDEDEDEGVIQASCERVVCVCINRYHKRYSILYNKQGATAPFISPWPTKLLMFGEDMQSDQLHVPANFRFALLWHGAKPRTPNHSNSVIRVRKIVFSFLSPGILGRSY